MKKIGVIGAGPAGLMAAIETKNENNQVVIFEGNDKIGIKLLMTGGGRCNITNSAFFDEFLENVVTNQKFIYSAFTRFDNFALIDFLKQNNIETIVEEDGRIFPKSEKASDLVNLFYQKLQEKSIILKTATKIKKVYKEQVFYLTDQNGKTYTCDYLIIATGGNSYPNTGSDGTGYALAYKLGHKINYPRPVLVPIFIKDKLNLKAQSFRNVRLKIDCVEGQVTIDGDLMINANFLTGPAALRASSFIRDRKIKRLSIDFLPGKSYKDLDEKILEFIRKNPKKSIGNALKNIINASLLEEILNLSNIDINKKASELSKEERKYIVGKMKDLNLNFDRLGGFESAVVTRGGVDVKFIDPKNMESKLVSGLFFVGEILDIDSLTGGFNLQTYFSTAYAAGTYIKENTWHIL